MADSVELNTDVLDKLIKTLKVKPPTARVGILGGHDSRTMQVQDKSGKINQVDNSNATIGAAHEFGTSKMPQRSFLRMPINEKLPEALEKTGAFNEDMLKDVVKQGKINTWMEKIAKLAEAIVIEAFASNGFGKWAAHSQGYTNNTGSILVDTQQLRNSISSDVKD